MINSTNVSLCKLLMIFITKVKRKGERENSSSLAFQLYKLNISVKALKTTNLRNTDITFQEKYIRMVFLL